MEFPESVYSVRRLALTVTLLLIGMFVYTVLNHYFPAIVQPMVFPLGILALCATMMAGFARLFRELREHSARTERAEQTIAELSRELRDMSARAQRAEQMLAELQATLDRLVQPADTRAAGFYVHPDATVSAPAASRDDEEPTPPK